MLPVLHLNGAKIGGPTVLARKDLGEVRALFEGTGTTSWTSRAPMSRNARALRGSAGRLLGEDPRHPALGAQRGLGRPPAALADDRAAHP